MSDDQAILIPESATLGALLIRESGQREAYAEVREIIKDTTSPVEANLIVLPAHRDIWDAIGKVLEKSETCDLVLLNSELASTGRLAAAGGVDYLFKIVSTVPNSARLIDYAKDITRLAARRRAMRLTQNVRDKISRGEPLNGDLERLALAESEASTFAKKRVPWQERFHTQLVRAEDLRPLIDAPIPYLINPLVVRGSLTQIQGIPKGGKSAFSLYLSLCASCGTWPYPQYLVGHDGTPLRVLYIAWEDPKIMMAKRLSLYAVGLGLDRYFMPDGLSFLFGPEIFIERADHLEALIEAMQETRADMVVIDTLSQVHLSDENEASAMKIPMAHLRRLAELTGCGLVYIHHTTKGGTAGGKATVDKGRGSGAIAAAWHVLVDWGIREDGSNVNPIEIQSKYEHEWRKWAVNYSALKDDVGQVTAVKWSIDAQESKPDEKHSSTKSKQHRLLGTMKKLAPFHKDGWMTAADLVEPSGLGLEARALKNHLTQLCQAGSIEFKPGVTDSTGKQLPNLYRVAANATM